MSNTYYEVTEWLFGQLPMFQNKGAEAYKPGLETTLRLSEMFGNPHRKIKAIHVAGTNGKGSTAHTVASVLQGAGYKVGLYTSPHLVDFRERIRVNGRMIPEKEVVNFVDDFRSSTEELKPSFFELTTIMAFRYFVRQKVDVAVIEVGLGGRLDSTNILTPILSVITNISLDHTNLLGPTEPEIAVEKAGIIKRGVPVVIGESSGEVRKVFARKASEEGTKITYADDNPMFASALRLPLPEEGYIYLSTPWGDIHGQLSGECQPKNANTVFHALAILSKHGWNISPKTVAKGFANVCQMTGLQGRWMRLSDSPLAICDTGHNVGGWQYIVRQLKGYKGKKRMVIGFVNDKDVTGILKLISTIPETEIIFTNAPIQRALPAGTLAEIAAEVGLKGDVVESVAEAYRIAMRRCNEDIESSVESGDSTVCLTSRSHKGKSNDKPARNGGVHSHKEKKLGLGPVCREPMVYVGGSTFVVAELLSSLSTTEAGN